MVILVPVLTGFEAHFKMHVGSVNRIPQDESTKRLHDHFYSRPQVRGTFGDACVSFLFTAPFFLYASINKQSRDHLSFQVRGAFGDARGERRRVGPRARRCAFDRARDVPREQEAGADSGHGGPFECVHRFPPHSISRAQPGQVAGDGGGVVAARAGRAARGESNSLSYAHSLWATFGLVVGRSAPTARAGCAARGEFDMVWRAHSLWGTRGVCRKQETEMLLMAVELDFVKSRCNCNRDLEKALRTPSYDRSKVVGRALRRRRSSVFVISSETL